MSILCRFVRVRPTVLTDQLRSATASGQRGGVKGVFY